MKKITITTIIVAAFSLIAHDTVQAQEESSPTPKADIVKAGATGCSGCPSHNKGGEQASEAYFPEGAAGRIVAPEEN